MFAAWTILQRHLQLSRGVGVRPGPRAVKPEPEGDRADCTAEHKEHTQS